MTTAYDAIVVGARCAGSPTAMLLARNGYRVLVLDKAAFPSDTLSTHYIHQPGGGCLRRWGLLDAVAGSGAPPLRTQALDVGPFVLRGSPPASEGVADGYCVRRSVLDKILVDAAAAAGAEIRQRFRVEELLRDGDRVIGVRGRDADGRSVAEMARIVIGADGMNSLVARQVAAATYDEHPTLTCAYFSYWSGVEIDEVELYARPGHAIIAAPTNDGLTMIIAYWPREAFHRVRADVEGHFLEALEITTLAARVRHGRRTERFRGTGTLPNFLRRAHGDGWALVGDAGHHKDPVLALGITDAFHAADLLADAVDAGLSGRRPLEVALAGYERRRDEDAAQGYRNTLDLAQLQPLPRDQQQLMRALIQNQEQADRFFGFMVGSVPAGEFFGPENMARIMEAATMPG